MKTADYTLKVERRQSHNDKDDKARPRRPATALTDHQGISPPSLENPDAGDRVTKMMKDRIRDKRSPSQSQSRQKYHSHDDEKKTPRPNANDTVQDYRTMEAISDKVTKMRRSESRAKIFSAQF